MRYSEQIVTEWIELSAQISESVFVKLQSIADEKAAELAEQFYSIMLEDPYAEKFPLLGAGPDTFAPLDADLDY